jgi:hypothetical protein
MSSKTDTADTADTATTLTVADTGRTTVRYTDPVTKRSRRRSFRTRRLAEIWVKHHESSAGFWRNSATASYCDAIARGDEVVVHV